MLSSSLRLYSIAAGLLTAVSLSAFYVARKRRKSPEQLEKQRRDFLQQVGRIIDGTVIDVAEFDQHGSPVQLLIYTYDVAGVSYEASQDVTHLRQYIDMHTCRIGLPASIRYDPQNPGNSIVIAEGWSGLRTGKILPLSLQQAAKKQGAQKASSDEKTEEAARSRT
jgi:hypothetical protein